MTTEVSTMADNWLYSAERLQLRENALKTLLRAFGSHMNADGSPEHSSKSIYNCAHDWVSQGHHNCEGILNYYHENYEHVTI